NSSCRQLSFKERRSPVRQIKACWRLGSRSLISGDLSVADRFNRRTGDRRSLRRWNYPQAERGEGMNLQTRPEQKTFGGRIITAPMKLAACNIFLRPFLLILLFLQI